MTDCYLILSHLQKDHNIGALLRSAAAFGVTEVVLVGRRKVPTTAAVGMDHVVRRTAFARFQDAVDHVRAQGARILGVEIDPSSKPIDEHPFDGPTAFVLGNEGQGLSQDQRRLCDGLVRIRQYGFARSLNVHVAGALCLHHFALWAGLPERPIEGSKFVPRTDGPDPNAAASQGASEAA
ncbi:MAG: TrmH family RNA methyltransferase [Planctomycetota bacterium]